MRAAGGDRLMWDWQLRVVCPSKPTNPRVPPSSQTMRNLLRGVRVFEDEKVGVGHALSAKLLHRRQLAVTKSMSLGAAEGDLRTLGGWNRADAMRDAYAHGPPVGGLLGQAGCDVSVGMYYLDYDRDRLQVSPDLERRVFPWIEDVERRANELADDADLDPDRRVHPFLNCLREMRVVLLQDFAMQRALEMEAPGADATVEDDVMDTAELPGRRPARWSMWKSLGVGVFVDERGEEIPEWTALVAAARASVREGIVPERTRLDTEFVKKDVMRAMNECAQASVVTTRRLDDLTGIQRSQGEAIEEIQKSMEALVEALRVDTRAFAGLAPAAPAAVGARDAFHDPDPGAWQPLLKAVAPARFGEDPVAACDAWKQIERFTWSSKQPGSVEDAKYRYAMFYRAMEGWAVFSTKPRGAALMQLHKVAPKLPSKHLASLHSVFFERLKLDRKEHPRPNGVPPDARAHLDQKFAHDFVRRLHAVVFEDASELYQESNV